MTRPHHPAILFAEDFDAPPGITLLDDPPESEPAPPAVGEVDVAAAREDGYAEGLRSGLAQAAADRAEVTRQMLDVIADRLDDARTEAARVAAESADAVARLLLGALAAALPALCAHHGAGEVAALARAVLPALAREPRVTVRVSSHVVRAVEQEIAHLDPDLQDRVALLATDAVPPGDARISWADGAATRDVEALWREIAEVLAPLDLMPLPEAVAA